jgi:hypothetical protein
MPFPAQPSVVEHAVSPASPASSWGDRFSFQLWVVCVLFMWLICLVNLLTALTGR